MPSFYLSVPLLFFRFWYLEAPGSLIKYFFSLNHTALQILSLPLLIKTFFKPVKNEYRKGLVGFSIGMGIFIKSVLIFVDLIVFSILILLEILAVMFFLFWPILTIYFLFI